MFSEDESDKYSALLFSEYALEMSNLDIYFDEKSVNDDNYFEIPRSDVHPLLAYFLGFILGGCFVYLLMRFKQNKRRINRINKASRN